MPRKTNGPVGRVPQGDRSSRRDVLKRALVLLGAAALFQPNGGVSGLAHADAGSPGQKKTGRKKPNPGRPNPKPKTINGKPPK